MELEAYAGKGMGSLDKVGAQRKGIWYPPPQDLHYPGFRALIAPHLPVERQTTAYSDWILCDNPMRWASKSEVEKHTLRRRRLPSDRERLP